MRHDSKAELWCETVHGAEELCHLVGTLRKSCCVLLVQVLVIGLQRILLPVHVLQVMYSQFENISLFHFGIS